jgi:riboflavin biosynthesis pyrimidine reductase
MVRVGNEWSHALFDGWFYRSRHDEQRGMPAVSLVFVQSADGNTGAQDPADLGGGDTDKHLVYEGLSRVDADGVLAGATTAADDELVFSVWHPQLVALRDGRPRHPAQIILTNRGELPLDTALLYTEPSLRVIVIAGSEARHTLSQRARGRRWIEVIDAGPDLDVRTALAELYARDIKVISAVGGRRTARLLLNNRAAADLYLTTSPEHGGEPATPLVEGALPVNELLLEKKGRGAESGVRFEHRVFTGGGG